MIASVSTGPAPLAPAAADSVLAPPDVHQARAAVPPGDGLPPLLRRDTRAAGDLPAPRATTAAAGLDAALDAADNTIAADISAFMLLYAKLVQEARNAARIARSVDLQAQVGAIQASAEEMRTAAAERFSAAVMAGTMQIVGGAMTVASAGWSLKQLSQKGLKPEDLTPGSKFMTNLTAYQQLSSGSGQMLEGMGKLCSASMEQTAALADARAKDDEALAAKAQAERDTDQDLVQTLGDTLRDIREKLAAIQQSAAEMNRGIARNI